MVESGNQIAVKTNLVGRAEAFRMMALAEVMKLPLLFLGVPGIGKTNVVRDYANARHSKDKVFVLETDEDTKPAEVKGRPNIKRLAEENIYEVLSPLVNKKYIAVNEIDKASSGMRNSLMSIMNEKVIFTGEEEVVLDYDVFVGTCNEIPKEEKKSPFWDRFVLKCTLQRLSPDQIVGYFKNGHKNHVENINIRIPLEKDLDGYKGITETKMRKLVEFCYDHCSDRTMSYFPKMVRAVGYIWSLSIDSAFVKTAEIMAGPTVAKNLADAITTKELKTVMDRIDMLHGLGTMDQVKKQVHDINVIVTNYSKERKLNDTQIREIEEALNRVLSEKGINTDDLKTILP